MSETHPQPARDDLKAVEQQPDILAEIQAEVAQDLADERPPAGGPAYQLVSALVVLAFGLGAAVLAWGYGLGSLRRPGPGLWPFVVSVLIIVLAVILLAIGRTLDDTEKFTRASLLVLVGAATFVGLGVLLPLVGFEIPAVLLGIIWLRFLGGESWRSTILVSVLTTAAFYFLFLYALSVPLPHLIAL
ncbi:tripartite tricarboxylate transporter TctB family protein [Nocardioides hwasunensis]|uniref:Tripartite tricarboxylate transporter TctB family protein n=1 Tax=Nocardioides hwasunensis TaxID=397258 RepID=A0ABR8MRZ9_9ACTN|nr:tripartite tricarboxylate transporter TctB family protein [Nocardioides hwasunensis]MBD3916909.1 tripartite tricarboxylate transporter TctB family protein [Nocardioides hwasunensis]